MIELRQIQEENDLVPNSEPHRPYAKKSFGQNFLVDPNPIHAIIAALDLRDSDVVVEIGPGRGALTEQLIERCGRVIAIELDRDMVSVLKQKFAGAENFRIVDRDALKIDWNELAEAEGSRIKLVANLPYNISTAILQRLIDSRNAFSAMILMFQREVVERITAPAGSGERGFLTVMTEAYTQAEKLFDVSPGSFRPVPKVWSSVVRLVPRETSPFDADPKVFRALVSTAFRQKRKTILNNLKSMPAARDPAELLRNAGIEPSRRAETLSIEEWESLFVRSL